MSSSRLFLYSFRSVSLVVRLRSDLGVSLVKVVSALPKRMEVNGGTTLVHMSLGEVHLKSPAVSFLLWRLRVNIPMVSKPSMYWSPEYTPGVFQTGDLN